MFSCWLFSKSIWCLPFSSPSEKKQTDVIAISPGERQHRCVNKARLLQSKWSLSKQWLCGSLCGWAVILGHGCMTLPRDSKQTVTLVLITRVDQTTSRINNAGENLSAATSATTCTQPRPLWISGSALCIAGSHCWPCLYACAIMMVWICKLRLVLKCFLVTRQFAQSFLKSWIDSPVFKCHMSLNVKNCLFVRLIDCK